MTPEPQLEEPELINSPEILKDNYSSRNKYLGITPDTYHTTTQPFKNTKNALEQTAAKHKEKYRNVLRN